MYSTLFLSPTKNISWKTNHSNRSCTLSIILLFTVIPCKEENHRLEYALDFAGDND